MDFRTSGDRDAFQKAIRDFCALVKSLPMVDRSLDSILFTITLRSNVVLDDTDTIRNRLMALSQLRDCLVESKKLLRLL